MSDAGSSTRVSRRWLEAAGWTCAVTLLWTADLVAKLSERGQTGVGKDTFRLVSEQATSAIAVLIMIGFVVRWLRLFPLRRDAWPSAVIGHTAGSILFAFGHHSLMTAMRIPWYALHGIDYVWREPFVANLVTEYQKDIKVYLGILLIISAYGLYLRGREPAETAHGGRLLVQTGRGRCLLKYDQIDYLAGARNYVTVHADGHEYIVRETMTRLMKQLAGGPFARTHRSYIVNIDRIGHIRTIDGKQQVVMAGGDRVPVSRSYREQFEAAIAGGK